MDITAPARQPVAANFVAHGAQAYAQKCGGVRADSPRSFERHLQQFPLHVLERNPGPQMVVHKVTGDHALSDEAISDETISDETISDIRSAPSLALNFCPLSAPSSPSRPISAPVARATARRTQFASSRTLPGQTWVSRPRQKFRSQARALALRSVKPGKMLRQFANIFAALAQWRQAARGSHSAGNKGRRETFLPAPSPTTAGWWSR